MNVEAAETWKDRATRLWLGVLIPPMAALLQLEANYALVPWACRSSQRWPFHLTSAITLAATIVAGSLSWRYWQKAEGTFDEDGAGRSSRSQFMALIGFLSSMLFLLVLISLWIPVLVYGPCER